MNNERILSHKMSQRLTDNELQNVSAAGTTIATANATYSPGSGADVNADISVDM